MRRRRVPRAALVVVVLAALSPVPVSDVLHPVGLGFLGLAAPVVLGVVGAVLALLDRALTVPVRASWAAGALAIGVVAPGITWVLVVLLFGP